MRHLFSPDGRRALEDVLQHQPLLAFDFDGTLAPIVARPDDARVPVPLARRLAQLAQRRPVAVVTGRRIADVVERLGFVPQYLVGNHGAEDPARPAAPHALAAMDNLRRLLDTRAPALQAVGVRVEDKGLSVALHYRLAADRAQAQTAIDDALATLDPALERFGGKCVVNVVPAGVPDKGEAVTALQERSGAGAVVFIGDDVNDESVFRRAGTHWLTVRIGRDDPQSSARFFLDSQAEVATLLQDMLDRLVTQG